MIQILTVLTLLLMAQVMLIQVASAADKNICRIDPESCDDSLSKTIRSNSSHYWCYGKGLKWPEGLKDVIQAEGVVSGDPHLGNFGVMPVQNLAGHRAMKFVNLDFDDAGQGPFALDFLRLVIAIKAIERDIQREDSSIKDFTGTRELLEAYEEGLSGRSVAVPRAIEKDIELGVSGYDLELQKYVEKRLSGADKTKISLNDKELEAIQDGDVINKKVAAQYLPGFTVLDVVRVKKRRGGSANEDRFWVLVQDKKAVKRIFEFKGWSSSALESFRQQLGPLAWAQSLYPVFWPGLDSRLYDFKKIGSQYFWLREKRKSLTDVPYETRKKKDLKFLSEVSLYVANELGQIHGRQKSAVKYKKLLSDEKVSELFRSTVKDFVNDYLNKFKILD